MLSWVTEINQCSYQHNLHQKISHYPVFNSLWAFYHVENKTWCQNMRNQLHVFTVTAIWVFNLYQHYSFPRLNQRYWKSTASIFDIKRKHLIFWLLISSSHSATVWLTATESEPIKSDKWKGVSRLIDFWEWVFNKLWVINNNDP